MSPSNPGNPGHPTAGALVNILQPAALQTLRDAYDDDTMTNALSMALPLQYPAAQEYIDALRHAFYGSPGPAPLLRADSRERCLIGILASRGANRNLAIHIYAGLMQGISVEEIGHILLLTGAYTGVDNLAHGLGILKTALEILAQLAADVSTRPTPLVVLTTFATWILM